MKARLLAVSVAMAALLAFAGVAFAAHESSNRFDLSPTAAAPGADGNGVSNYLAGASTPDNELWNSTVRVAGLAPNTTYTFWAENNNDTFEPTMDFPVCSFTTDANGNGNCVRTRHNEPALAIARIRLGEESVFGVPVLEARRIPMDADRKVDDGEIESSGANRDK